MSISADNPPNPAQVETLEALFVDHPDMQVARMGDAVAPLPPGMDPDTIAVMPPVDDDVSGFPYLDVKAELLEYAYVVLPDGELFNLKDPPK